MSAIFSFFPPLPQSSRIRLNSSRSVFGIFLVGRSNRQDSNNLRTLIPKWSEKFRSPCSRSQRLASPPYWLDREDGVARENGTLGIESEKKLGSDPAEKWYKRDSSWREWSLEKGHEEGGERCARRRTMRIFGRVVAAEFSSEFLVNSRAWRRLKFLSGRNGEGSRASLGAFNSSLVRRVGGV